jgi:hypothetical protein
MGIFKIKNNLACLAAAVLLAVGASAQSPAQGSDADRERAAALWEEAIRAKGGRGRLHAVENLLISSSVDVRAKRGSAITETERLYAMPGRAWIFKLTPDYDVSLEATVINPDRSLCSVTMYPVGSSGSVPGLSLCLPTTPLEYLVQDPVIYLMETRWVRPVPVRARTEGEGGKRIDVVETMVGRTRVDFYLHHRTRLPFKIVTDQFDGVPQLTDKMGLTVYLEKYEVVDGIQMPRRVTRQPSVIESTVEEFRHDIESSRYRFNVSYDEKIFEQPVPKNVKRGDWKASKED